MLVIVQIPLMKAGEQDVVNNINMKKIIGIVIIISLLSSCSLTFGNYDRYQSVHGNKMCNAYD